MENGAEKKIFFQNLPKMGFNMGPSKYSWLSDGMQREILYTSGYEPGVNKALQQLQPSL